MRIVVQRVSEASVSVDQKVVGEISHGLLILLGIQEDDQDEDINYLVKKAVNLRIFSDEKGLMNLSLLDKGFEVLLISQFTLYADCRKGNRPSYSGAAKPVIAIPIYEKFIAAFEKEIGKKVKTGIFGADMKVSLINDGPVTITLDSKNKSF